MFYDTGMIFACCLQQIRSSCVCTILVSFLMPDLLASKVDAVQDRADVPDDQCIAFYWNDCCSSNEALESELTASSTIGPHSSLLLLKPALEPALLMANAVLAGSNCHCPRLKLKRFPLQQLCYTDMILCNHTFAGPPAGVQQHPASAFCIEGQMRASKGRQAEHAANQVHVMICVLRLPHVTSDIVISLSTAVSVSEHSAAAADAGAGSRTDHLRAPGLFESMIQTFAINDWGLFGDS